MKGPTPEEKEIATELGVSVHLVRSLRTYVTRTYGSTVAGKRQVPPADVVREVLRKAGYTTEGMPRCTCTVCGQKVPMSPIGLPLSHGLCPGKSVSVIPTACEESRQAGLLAPRRTPEEQRKRDAAARRRRNRRARESATGVKRAVSSKAPSPGLYATGYVSVSAGGLPTLGKRH